jgi:2-keto-4-pentenoate hydratase
MSALPEAIRPATREEGYAIQAVIESQSATPRLGWKIAATSAAGQTHLQVDGPLAGRLLREGVGGAGEVLPFGWNRMRVAEAEFAFLMGAGLPPRSARYSAEEVLAAAASLHPAIEIPDTRFEEVALVGAPQLIADNACAHGFVLGPPSPPIWRSMDLAHHQVLASVAGKDEREGIGANVLGSPLLALAWLANELSDIGIGLQEGEIVTTGTCIVPLPIEPFDRVTADFGPLGKIELRLGG